MFNVYILFFRNDGIILDNFVLFYEKKRFFPRNLRPALSITIPKPLLNTYILHLYGWSCKLLAEFQVLHFLNKKHGNHITAHCKLTRRRRSNSIDITVTALLLRCSSCSDFTHKCKKSKFIVLHITSSKHFYSFQ